MDLLLSGRNPIFPHCKHIFAVNDLSYNYYFLHIYKLWSKRYFALWAKIHGAECCGAKPQKLELIRSFAPPF